MKNLLFGCLALFAVAFTSCKDKCKDVECKNNGVCNEGVCECPTGYSGDDCGSVVTPSKITISQIDVIDFPGTDGGSDWDPVIETDPDIVIELHDDANSTNVYTSSNFDNMADGTQFSINGLAIDITNVTSSYTLKMFDYDLTSSDDAMGDVTFTPFNGAAFPSSFTVSDAALEISYRLHVTYAW